MELFLPFNFQMDFFNEEGFLMNFKYVVVRSQLNSLYPKKQRSKLDLMNLN